MPRKNSQNWSVGDTITAVKQNYFNADIDDLYANWNDRWRIRQNTWNALQIDIATFVYTVGTNIGVYAGWTWIAMTVSSTNYVMIDASWTIVVNTVGWVQWNARLGVVITSWSAITSIAIRKSDVVGWNLGWAPLTLEKDLVCGDTFSIGSTWFLEPQRAFSEVGTSTWSSSSNTLSPAATTYVWSTGWTNSRGCKCTANRDMYIIGGTGQGMTNVVVRNSAGTVLDTCVSGWSFASPVYFASGAVFYIESSPSWFQNVNGYRSASMPSAHADYTITDASTNGTWAGALTYYYQMVAIVSAPKVNNWLNIWDVTWNSYQSFRQFWSGVSGSTAKLPLWKIWAPANGLLVRIETDNGSWSPSWTLVHANAVVTISNASITTTMVDFTVTFGWSFIIPLWQLVHVVLCHWTYWSPTINASNYYLVWYTTFHTTSKYEKAWSGATPTWWSTTNKFVYTSSTLFSSEVMSLTDADYIYITELPCISTVSATPWWVARFEIGWYSTRLTGAKWDKQYLWNTPWASSNAPWTNSYQLGDFIAQNVLKIDPKYLSTLTLTPWVGAVSPFTYRNTSRQSMYFSIIGGTVSLVQFSRDGTTYYTVFTATGCAIEIWSFDYVKITYTVAPTIIAFYK